MKKIVLLLISVLLTVCFSSCEFHSPVPQHGDKIRFVVKKSLFAPDRYGLERKNFADGSWNLTIEPIYEEISTKITYYEENKKTGKFEAVTTDHPAYKILIGRLNGKEYYFDDDGYPFCLRMPVKKMYYLGKLYNQHSCMGPGFFMKMVTEDNQVFIYRLDGKAWQFQFYPGPHKDIKLGVWGYAFLEESGWGYKYKFEGSGRAVEFFAAEYDEIIEIHDSGCRVFSHDVIILARKGSVWYGIDRHKNPVKVPTKTIKMLKKYQEVDAKNLGFNSHGKRAGIVIVI